MTHLRHNHRQHGSCEEDAHVSSLFLNTPLCACLYQSIHLCLFYIEIHICVTFLSKNPQTCWHPMLCFSQARYSRVSGHGKQQGSADLTKFPLRTAPTPTRFSFFNPFNICHSKFVSYHFKLSCSIKSNTVQKSRVRCIHKQAQNEIKMRSN